MAVKNQPSKPSIKILMSFLLFILTGWIILISWGLSIWGLVNFNTAEQSLYELSKKQATTLPEFHRFQVGPALKSWMDWLPLESISSKITNTSHELKTELDSVFAKNSSDLNDITGDFITAAQQMKKLLSLSASIIFIKLILLMTSIPLFLLAITAGLIDGLNLRAIRTASLGRESSYVFHQLNRFFKRGLLLLLAVWFLTPMNIRPALLFVPVSILLSLVVSITTSRFKKYI